MQPYIEFNRDKIKARFGSLPKFAKTYKLESNIKFLNSFQSPLA
ncbi:hypothetical protein [Helicobacter suis]|nr:hypothetical protein [Helicobacter suis]